VLARVPTKMLIERQVAAAADRAHPGFHPGQRLSVVLQRLAVHRQQPPGDRIAVLGPSFQQGDIAPGILQHMRQVVGRRFDQDGNDLAATLAGRQNVAVVDEQTGAGAAAVMQLTLDVVVAHRAGRNLEQLSHSVS